MWSPNTATPTTTKANDNKIREEIDDCRCSDAGAGSSGGGAAAGGSTTEQQQKLNVFDNNSKIPASSFGGNLPAHDSKEKELAHAAAETVDSGFISGPQSTNIFQEEQQGEQNKGSVPQQKYNIAPGPFVGKTVAAEEAEKTVLDSGCIDEDESFADEDDDDDGGDHEAASIAAQNRIGAVTACDQQLQQQHEGARNELSATKSKLGSSASKSASSYIPSSNTEQMILKQNVDAGMSEWFCNLSLQTEATPRPQTQQQQQQVAGTSLNNLDAAVRKAANTSSRQQQQATGNSATPTTNTNATTANTNLTPSNAWEQFYQQNDDGDTPLHLACISGYVDVVAALIRMAPHPCLFNIQNDEAQTPLHLAALTAQPKILRMLLIAGAEPTLRDRHGNTALHLACISGEEQCVRALTIPISASEINEAHRQYGHRSNDKTVSYLSCARLPSDLEIRNYDGERCVHLAAQAGHIDLLRILVLYGADINAREGKSGRTPLHIAIECCNEDLANFLLDECQKLNLETATYAGLTAYQVACILNKSQMQNILEKRGAEPLTPPDSDYDSSDIENDLEDTKSYDRFGDPGYFANYNGGNAMTVA